MTPHPKIEGHDHFYGFSRWSKEVMPNSYPNIFSWTDMDMLFENYTTGKIYLIEVKFNDAKIPPYQFRLLKRMEKLGVQLHILRMSYEQKYFGDQENLGDPRLAIKIHLDGQEVTYEKFIEQFNEWHGTHGTQNHTEQRTTKEVI